MTNGYWLMTEYYYKLICDDLKSVNQLPTIEKTTNSDIFRCEKSDEKGELDDVD